MWCKSSHKNRLTCRQNQSVGPGALFGLENMVTLIIGSGKVDLGGKGREPMKTGDRLCWELNGGKALS